MGISVCGLVCVGYVSTCGVFFLCFWVRDVSVRAVMLWLLMLSLRITSAVEDHLVWLPVNFRCFVVVLFLCPFFLLPCPVIFNPAGSVKISTTSFDKQASKYSSKKASEQPETWQEVTNEQTNKQTNKQTDK